MNKCRLCGKWFEPSEEAIQEMIDAYENTTREEAINIIEYCSDCA